MNTTQVQTYNTTQTTQANQPTNNSNLDKDAFLKILITQLQNQDPLQPMEDRDFIAQMAQFSSLEQMTNMSLSLARFIELQSNSSLSQHSQLIGQKVYWEEQEEDLTLRGEGVVQAVSMKEGQVYVDLIDDNGDEQQVLLQTIYRVVQNQSEENNN